MKKSFFLDKFKYICKGYKPLCTLDEGILLYHKQALFIYKSSDNDFDKIMMLDSNIKLRLKESTRLLSRVFRPEPYTGVVFGEMLFIALRSKIVQISLKDYSVVYESRFRKQGIHIRRFNTIIGVPGFEDCIAYGEYFSNAEHESVNLYCSVKEGNHYKWECKHVFPPNTIRHIHSLVPDPHNECVYIFTGDSDSESGIWRATDGFRNVTPLWVGDQKYRAGTAYVRDNCLFYATDSPCKENMIAKINLENGEFQKLCNFPGSCTSSCIANGKFVFCSTIEPEEPKNHGSKEMFRYYFSKKLASGMTDGLAHVYIENNLGGFDDLIQCEKDIWPGPLCQFGRAIPFYSNKEMYLYFVGVKHFDGKLYKGEIWK